MKRNREVQPWPISELRPHPKQHRYTDLPDAKLAELAHSMRRRGLDHPVQILPDGTIIKGHQRVRAAKTLNWPRIDVIVRHDLVDDPIATLVELIEDNHLRRHSDPLAIARDCNDLYDMLPGRNSLDPADRKAALPPREQIGKLLGISGRHVARLLRLLNTPTEVQQAASAGTLTVVEAGKIAGLPAETQDEIATAIRGGCEPRKALETHRTGTVKPANAGTAYRRLIKQLKNANDELAGQVSAITGMTPIDTLQILEHGQSLLRELIKYEKANLRDQQDAPAHLQDAIDEINGDVPTRRSSRRQTHNGDHK